MDLKHDDDVDRRIEGGPEEAEDRDPKENEPGEKANEGSIEMNDNNCSDSFILFLV